MEAACESSMHRPGDKIGRRSEASLPSLVYIYIYAHFFFLSEVGGMAPTGKSCRFVRALRACGRGEAVRGCEALCLHIAGAEIRNSPPSRALVHLVCVLLKAM